MQNNKNATCPRCKQPGKFLNGKVEGTYQVNQWECTTKQCPTKVFTTRTRINSAR